MRKNILTGIIWGIAGYVLFTKDITYITWQFYALFF